MSTTPDPDALDWDRARDGLMADAATADNAVTTEPYTPTDTPEA